MRGTIWIKGDPGLTILKDHWVKEWTNLCSPWSANALHLKLWLEMPTIDLRKFISWDDIQNNRWNECKVLATIGTLLQRKDRKVSNWRSSFIQHSVVDICKRRRLEKNLEEMVDNFAMLWPESRHRGWTIKERPEEVKKLFIEITVLTSPSSYSYCIQACTMDAKAIRLHCVDIGAHFCFALTMPVHHR